MQASAGVRTGVVATALAAMVLVPITALPGQRPAFLGWQMYSAQATSFTVTATLDDGSTEVVPMASLTAQVRPELDIRRAAAEWICAKRDDVGSVHLTREYPKVDWEWTCERS